MNSLRLFVITWIVTVMGAAGIAAQSPPSQQQMAFQLRQNQEELQRYSWKSTYSYLIDGVQKRVEEYTIRFFDDGTRQRMQISGKDDKTKVHRPDGTKLSKKEREAAYAFVMEVKGQLDSYLNPFFSEQAVKKATTTTEGESFVLKANDVVSSGDTVEIRYELKSGLPETATITTFINGSPVSLEIQFGTMEVGPNFAASSTTKATWEGLHLEIATENSDFKKVRR